MKALALVVALAAAAAHADDVARPHLLGSVHLFPFTSFPDLLGASVTVSAIPWVDLTGGVSGFTDRFGWWARGGPRFELFDQRDAQQRGWVWRVSVLAGYRAFRDARANVGGFSGALSTDLCRYVLPHLGITVQAAMGGTYDAVGKRLLPELRLGVGVTF